MRLLEEVLEAFLYGNDVKMAGGLPDQVLPF
jgi:hypothetical protein